MQSIARIGGATAPALSGRVPGRAATRDAPSPASRTALVPVAPGHPPDAGLTPGRRPLSAFVAQLIATQRREPQTRERRRAEPADAIALYTAGGRARARAPAVVRSL
jgi:hypothetical protein